MRLEGPFGPGPLCDPELVSPFRASRTLALLAFRNGYYNGLTRCSNPKFLEAIYGLVVPRSSVRCRLGSRLDFEGHHFEPVLSNLTDNGCFPAEQRSKGRHRRRRQAHKFTTPAAMILVRQTGNEADGDIVAGNKNTNNFNIVHATSNEELNALYAKLKLNDVGDPSDGNFCEKLEHYLSANSQIDVRGLREKLIASGRADLISFATDLKERATKAVMKHQTSRTAQRIYTIVLDDLHTRFSLTVTPLIEQGAPRPAVDLSIKQILDETRSMLGENVLEITVKDLYALLYFLGGNCHIRWDKC